MNTNQLPIFPSFGLPVFPIPVSVRKHSSGEGDELSECQIRVSSLNKPLCLHHIALRDNVSAEETRIHDIAFFVHTRYRCGLMALTPNIIFHCLQAVTVWSGAEHYITLRYVSLRYVTLRYVASHHITSHRIASHHITSHHTTPRHITSYHSITSL